MVFDLEGIYGSFEDHSGGGGLWFGRGYLVDFLWVITGARNRGSKMI